MPNGAWTVDQFHALFGSRVPKLWSLLNHDRHGFWRNLLLRLDLFLPFVVGCVLARGDLVEGAPLRLHPDVRIT